MLSFVTLRPEWLAIGVAVIITLAQLVPYGI